MYRLKRGIIVLLFFFATMASASGQHLKTIAFAQDNMANDFRKAQVFEVRDAIKKHPGLIFVHSDAKGRTSLLIRHIEQFIDADLDLLIVGTNHADAVVPVVSKAYLQGIPVIVLDRGINTLDYTTFINSDNINIGKMAAQYLAEKLNKKGRILLFEGLKEADVTQLRTQGFMAEIAKYKDIDVIKRTGNYLRRDAIFEMEKLLESGEHIDAIFSESDSMLSGVRLVLERHHIDPASIITIGCDYTREAREAIRAGTQSASILFPLGGDQSVDVALKILAKEKVPKHIVIPVKLVTQHNVEEIGPIF